jgi:hypothetical protein
MKNIKTFEEFLSEGILLEKKTFSPANVKKYELNKRSVDALRTWKFKLDDIEATFKDSEYFGDEPDLFDFISGKRDAMYGRFEINIAGIPISLKISSIKNQSNIEFDSHYLSMYVNIKKSDLTRYVEGNPDSILGFIDLLNYVFDEYSKDITDFVKSKMGLETLYVIEAGKIAPASGKTSHGWSIYDQPNNFLGFTKSTTVLWSAGELKVGDKFKLVDDQNHKVLYNEVEITDVIKANYKDFVAYSKKRGANIPIGSFQKQPGTFQFTLYSIK